MRTTLLLVLAAVLAGTLAVVLTRPGEARAVGIATLHVEGLDVGRGQRAIVRLHNTSEHPADVYSVNYTVYAQQTLSDTPVALSQPGAGVGARLAPGQTLELDLGAIVDAYRAQQEVGPWDAPLRLVAFGTGGSFLAFGPGSVQVEALQTDGSATYAAPVRWITE